MEYTRTHLLGGETATDCAGFLGAQVERHVLLVGEELTELSKRARAQRGWRRVGHEDKEGFRSLNGYE